MNLLQGFKEQETNQPNMTNTPSPMSGHELIEAFRAGRTDFSGENLYGIKLRGAHLDGIIMNGADLRESDLSGASFFRASLRGAMLNRAHLGIFHDLNTDPNLDDIDIQLGCVNMEQADLSGAFLNHALMFNINLRQSNLENADLRDAHMRQADLSGANLNGANLSGADLSEARLSTLALKHAGTANTILDHIIDLDLL